MQPPYIYVCFPGWANYINVFAVSLEDRKEKQPKISKYGLHIFMSRVFLPSKKKYHWVNIAIVSIVKKINH